MRHNKTTLGFTMVELLVVLGIFSVMTGVVLGKYRTYNTNALFANASEDIVLALRQAQVYGVGVKGSSGNFDVPYGVYFNTGANSISLFGDGNSDRVFTTTEDTGLVNSGAVWNSSISIFSLSCGGAACLGNKASVTFKRPNPDAFISDTAGLGTSKSYLTIIVKDSNTSKTATVTITNAGQISLQ